MLTGLLAPELRVDFCGHRAAEYAVHRWHYSKRMAPVQHRFGVWEGGDFVGAVLFGVGAASNIGKPFGLNQPEICELVRVAMGSHITPTTAIVARALALLAGKNPSLRLVISYADSAAGHHGGMYQAGNWLYLGESIDTCIVVHGVTTNRRTLGTRYGVGGQSIPWLREHIDPDAMSVVMPPKYRYAYPLDRKMRHQLLPLALPYPKPNQERTGQEVGSIPPSTRQPVGLQPPLW